MRLLVPLLAHTLAVCLVCRIANLQVACGSTWTHTRTSALELSTWITVAESVRENSKSKCPRLPTWRRCFAIGYVIRGDACLRCDRNRCTAPWDISM